MSDIAGSAEWAAAPTLLTFPSEDVGALARALAQLLAERPQARARAGAENRRWAWAQAGVETWCARMCELYETLL